MSDSFTFSDPISPGSTVYAWGDPNNWSTGTVANGNTLEVFLGGFVAPADTIVVDAAYTINLLANQESSAQVWIDDGGSLEILSEFTGFGFYYGGGITVADGTLDIASSDGISNGLTVGAPSLLEIPTAGGFFEVDGGTNSDLAGTVTGAGTLLIDNGQVTLAGGADLAIAALTLGANTTIELTGNVGFAGAFEDGGFIDLNGNTLTLSGQVGLINTIGTTGDTGRVVVSQASGFEIGLQGQAFEPSYLAVDGNDVLEITQSATQVGALYLGISGSDAAELVIDPNATYTIVGGDFVGGYFTADEGSVDNAGSMIVAAATAQAEVQSTFDNTGVVTVTTGALLLAGATLVNAGQFVIDAGATLATGAVASTVAELIGTGSITVEGGADFTVAGSVGAGQSISLGPDGLLSLDAPAQFAAAVVTFDAGATIDLVDTQAVLTGQTLDGATGLVDVTLLSGTTDISLLLQANSQGYVAQQSGNDTLVELACFAAGTRIATEAGEVAVEALRPGMHVLTLAGPQQVVWIGRRRVDVARHPAPRSVAPVRVRADAFGPGRPARDLLLSPDHAVFAEEVLIPIKHLVNGRTVCREQVDRVVYHHVELARHAVIFAEGLPTESLLNTGDRSAFDNAGGAVQLHPAFGPFAFGHVAAPVGLLWEALGCAPLVVVGAEVDRVRESLLRQADALERVRRAKPAKTARRRSGGAAA